MINVPIDRIVPLTDARDNFSKIVADIESQDDGMYVLTKGGKPSIALINISYLARLINEQGKAPAPTNPSAPSANPMMPRSMPQPKPFPKPPVKSFEVKPATPAVNTPSTPSFDAKLPPVNTPKPDAPKNTPVASNIATGIDPSWINGGVNNTPSSNRPSNPKPIIPTPEISKPVLGSNAAPLSPTPTEAAVPPITPTSSTLNNQPDSKPAASISSPGPAAPSNTELKPTPAPLAPSMPKPVNPWPILPSREAKSADSPPTTNPQPASDSIATKQTDPLASPPSLANSTPSPLPVSNSIPETSKPAPVPEATPSTNEPSLPPINRKPDLPPPPANDVSIPFDEPPKTDSEPGEATTNNMTTSVAPTTVNTQGTNAPTASTSAAPPAPKPAVQDLEI